MSTHEVLIRTSSGLRRVQLGEGFVSSLRVPVGRKNEQAVCLFVASWLALLSDSPIDPTHKPFKTYITFLNRIRDEGLKHIVVEFTELAHQLVSRHTLMGGGTSIGDFIPEFKNTPVFFEYIRYMKTGDVELLSWLYTFLNFGKKMEYVDPSFDETAFRGWLDVEQRLSEHKYSDQDLLVMRKILAAVLPRFQITDFAPKFGPGSVSERAVHGRLGKLKVLAYDAVIDRFLFHGHIGYYGCGGDQGLDVSKVIPDPSRWDPDRGISSRIARLMFVPKNLKVSRSICMEPNTYMFFQQGIADQAMRLIRRSPLAKFIDIRDQSRNRQLALDGSATSEVDTLDLSAASDSLSYDLVKAIFPPSWQIVLRITRSRYVQTPDGLRTVRKFAPMGSALCFPTQCIVFTACGIYAACVHTYEQSSSELPFLEWLTDKQILSVIGTFREAVGYAKSGYQPMAVYGDDICIDGNLTVLVKSILDRLGFVVNEEKSFVGGQAFRESCGGYYLNGHDITPLYYRVKGVRVKLSASHVASQVNVINECYRRRYVNTYRFLHNSLVRWDCHRKLKNGLSWKNPIPYVSCSSTRFGILCATPENKHLRVRNNSDLQREDMKAWTIAHDYVVSPSPAEKQGLDHYEHVRWWASARVEESFSEDMKPSASRRDTGGARLCWRWIPTE